MATLRVSGVPKNLKLMRFVTLMKKTLYDLTQKFYVHPKLITGKSLSSGVKDMLVDFPTVGDATVAQERMDNFTYTYNNEMYVFNTSITQNINNYNLPQASNKKKKGNWMHQEHDDYQDHMSEDYEYKHKSFADKDENKHLFMDHDGYKRKQSYNHHGPKNSYYQERSCSSDNNNPTSLNMEIELLKKQRLIIQEERKLLLEQKKLDELKMLNMRNKTSSFPQKRKADSDFVRAPKKYKQPKPLPPNQLPSFYKPCGVLISSMSAHLEKHAPCLERRKLVLKLLRLKLRERIALAVDGHRLYKTGKIIYQYRKLHPVSGDEDLIKDLVKTINDTCWPGGDIKLNKKGFPKKINPRVYDEAACSIAQSAPREDEATENSTETGKNDSSTNLKRTKTKVVTNDDGVIEIEDSDTIDLEIIESTQDANVKDKAGDDKKYLEKSDQIDAGEDSSKSIIDLTKKQTATPEVETSNKADIYIIDPKQDNVIDIVEENKNESEKNDQTKQVENLDDAFLEISTTETVDKTSNNVEIEIIDPKENVNIKNMVEENKKEQENRHQNVEVVNSSVVVPDISIDAAAVGTSSKAEQETIEAISIKDAVVKTSNKTDASEDPKPSAVNNEDNANIPLSQIQNNLDEWPVDGEDL